MKPEMKVWTHKITNRFKYAHLKRDGHFTEVIKNDSGTISFWSSLPTQLHGLNFLPELPALQRMPNGSIVLGELWLPGKQAEYIKTAIIERNTALRFESFAVTRWNGQTAGLAEYTLRQVEILTSSIGLPFVPFTQLDPADTQATFRLAVEPLPVNAEGYVLKNGNLLDWHKLKPRKTVDCVCTGITQGKGKYSGQIGALVVSVYHAGKLVEIANVSGMTDTQRKYFSENFDKLLGSVVEVEYQSVGNQGRLRHPAFIRQRDDKAATACDTSQDSELLRIWDRQNLQRILFD